MYRLIFIISLTLSLLPAALSSQNVAPATVEGSIFDKESGEPLMQAHVFLSGTSIGTVTDYAGRFTLDSIPPGVHTLTVSIIGYERVSDDLILSPGERRTERLELNPVVYKLGELYVGNLDERWEKHLERFYDLFIGESARADSVEILNPEVLRFESRWWGRFTAEALAPLQIENRATGYRITYHLDDFRHSGSITRWDGDSFFTPLTPADSLQEKQWENQRRDAFYGSLRHFFLSLLSDRLSEEKFSISRIQNYPQRYPHSNPWPASKEQIISNTDEEGYFHLSYFGKLKIIYSGSGEDPGYVRWAREPRGPAGNQTSYLELEQRPVTIDQNGEIVEPYGATRSGYLSYTRFSEALPKEYRPEGWEERIPESGLTNRRDKE